MQFIFLCFVSLKNSRTWSCTWTDWTRKSRSFHLSIITLTFVRSTRAIRRSRIWDKLCLVNAFVLVHTKLSFWRRWIVRKHAYDSISAAIRKALDAWWPWNVASVWTISIIGSSITCRWRTATKTAINTVALAFRWDVWLVIIKME